MSFILYLGTFQAVAVRSTTTIARASAPLPRTHRASSGWLQVNSSTTSESLGHCTYSGEGRIEGWSAQRTGRVSRLPPSSILRSCP